MDSKPNRWALWLVAFGSALWGTDTVFRQPLTGSLSSLQLVLYEHLLLMFVFVPVCIWHRKELKALGMREWGALLWVSWGGSAIGLICFTEAIRIGNPNTAILLQKSQPLFAAILAAVVLGETLRARFWIYLAGATGAVLIISFGDRPLAELASPAVLRGAPKASMLLALTAAVLWAGSTVLGRHLSGRLSFSALTALRIVTALPLLLGLNAIAGNWRLPSLNHSQLLALGWMSFVPGCCALLIYYRGLRHTPASLAAIAELSFPATAVLLNWIFLGSRFTVTQCAGFLLLYGIILLLRNEQVRERPISEQQVSADA